jgi:DNA-directed RNA polymerase subunit RPC12/RpoP
MSVDKVTAEYNGRQHVLVKTGTWCPNCGMKQVWMDDSDDYYEGCTYVCFSCEHHFTMPRLERISVHDTIYQNYLKAIRGA